MRIQHNLAGINSYRQLNITMLNQSKSAEKLSSAYKINRAADDAAGLSISEKMRAQIRGLNRGAENIEDGISFTQVADGALHEAHAILQRINELAVQSANGTNSESDRVALDNEVQQLKTELERIFTTTTFNDEQIWPDDYIKNTPQVVGSIQVQAVKMTTPSSQKNDISNANFDQIAKGSYTIVATDTGVGLSWNDYNGDPHTTNEITWDQLRADDFKFRASSLFNEDDLFDANGDPLFDFEVSMKVKPQASNAAIKKAIDGTRMSSYAYASLSAETQDSFGAQTAIQGVSWGASIEYSAAYESRKNVGTAGYDFDNVQDAFFEPVPVTGTGGNKISGPYTTDVDVAKESTQGWKYRFNLQGVGTVTATSSSIYYYSSDKSSDAEGTWWHYEYPTYGQKYVSTNYYYPSEKGDGTLGSMMAALTGAKDTDTPGLLSSEQLTNQGGNIVLTFDLTKDSDGTKIGELTMNLKVSGDPNETEASVLEKINAALNVDPNTQKDVIIDFKTSSTNLQTTYNVVNKSTEKTSTVAENVYEDDLAYTYIDLNIHGGPSSKDQMLHKYQCLRLGAIDMEESNVLTEEACMETLDTVGAAIQKISRERSQFGAFQNRLEHARDIDKNTAENTTAAESRIRDTDMAEQMVEHSKHNILMNAGQAMLAQANSSTQGVVNLIK